MSEKCFLCLSNTSNKICTKCKCYSHPRCWGKYLQNTTSVTTIIYPNHCSIMTPYSIKCPCCRSEISNVKSLTRSDTKLGRKQFFLMNVRNMLFYMDTIEDFNEKLKVAKDIFNMILDNKQMIKDIGLTNFIKDRLKFLYTEGWDLSNIFYLRIFGEQLVK
jgi:hypothetical protein